MLVKEHTGSLPSICLILRKTLRIFIPKFHKRQIGKKKLLNKMTEQGNIAIEFKLLVNENTGSLQSICPKVSKTVRILVPKDDERRAGINT